jgi:p-hydroxybenzoate 3-monooxygenase
LRLSFDTDEPSVGYTDLETGERVRLDCDFVAGCDGVCGVPRTCLPPEGTTVARHDFGIGWLALLAEAPPSSGCVVFGVHPRGFAGHMTAARRSPATTSSARPATTRRTGPTSASGPNSTNGSRRTGPVRS